MSLGSFGCGLSGCGVEGYFVSEGFDPSGEPLRLNEGIVPTGEVVRAGVFIQCAVC